MLSFRSALSKLATPIGIAVAYVVISLLWVIGGDWLLLSVLGSELAMKAEIVKGTTFVLLTAVGLWALMTARERMLRAADDQVAMTESRYQFLFEAHPEPAFVFDASSFHILDTNDAACQLYGYSRDELKGLTIEELRIPSERPGLAQMVKDSAKGITHRQTVHLRKDRSWVEVRVTHSPVRLGSVDARLAVAIDISAQKAAERQRQEAYEELDGRVRQRTAELLQANEEMAAFCEAVSHDLTTPLQNIRQWARAISTTMGDKEDGVSESARRIAGASLRSETLLGELLGISSTASALATEGLSLPVMIYETLGALERTTDGISSRFVLREPMPWIMGHRATVQRALAIILRDSADRSDPSETKPMVLIGQREGGMVRLICGGPERDVARGGQVAVAPLPPPPDLPLAGRALRRMGGELTLQHAQDSERWESGPRFQYTATFIANELSSEGGKQPAMAQPGDLT